MRVYTFYLFDDVPLECEDSKGRFTMTPMGNIVGNHHKIIEHLRGPCTDIVGRYIVFCVWNTNKMSWHLRAGFNFEVLN